MTPLVELRGAAFGYEGRAVVRDATLAIRPGELVCLVGANGSGKTTLLRGLLGLLPPLAGELRHASDLRIGYVPQRDALDPLFPLLALDVALLGTYADAPAWRPLGSALRARARAALDACHAGDLARRRHSELSGGQRQRVLLARALAADPEVLLLDEPLAGVDAAAERGITDVLLELRRARGIAIWIVSHQPRALFGRLDGLVTVDGGDVRVESPA